VSKFFSNVLLQDHDISPAVAAIKTLLEYIRLNDFGTVAELREKLIKAIDTLTKTDTSAISVKSGCEMLLRFITLTALDAGVSKI
jgi:translation initiation factor eIF-2B subunit alpha